MPLLLLLQPTTASLLQPPSSTGSRPAACACRALAHNNRRRSAAEVSQLPDEQSLLLQPQQQQQQSTTLLSNNITPFGSSSRGGGGGGGGSATVPQPPQQPHDEQSSSSSASADACELAATSTAAAASSVMTDFLTAYGLLPADIARLAHECPQLFAGSGSVGSSICCHADHPGPWETCCASWEDASPAAAVQSAAAEQLEALGVESGGDADETSPPAPAAQAAADVYEVGRTLLFFHSLGWSHSNVLRRIIALYPQLLTKQVDRDILPVLRTLRELGCSSEDTKLLVWEFPRIFCSSNYQRHIRKFRYLGLYGLPPPGQQPSSRSSGSSSGSDSSDSATESVDSLERIMRWL